MLGLICQMSPSIGASALAALALISIVLWRGGTIEKISIPTLFEVKLEKPVHFTGNRLMLYLAVVAFVAAIGLMGLQAAHKCERCDRLPRETAWIYVGEAHGGVFVSTVPIALDLKGVAPQDVPAGSWITLTERREIDPGIAGTKSAMDSPVEDQGRHTCKVLPIGQRLYVVDKRFEGPPSNDVRHLWLRVTLTKPG